MRPLPCFVAGWLILAGVGVSPAARRLDLRPAPVECKLIALPGNSFTFVGPPDPALRQFLIGQAVTSTFEVTYIGFGGVPDAQTAFQAAVDVWSTLVASPVPIKVRAEFKPLGANVLGSAGGQLVWRDFPGAPIGNSWYVDALADRVAGSDLNSGTPSSFDILASFNSSFSNWYFGTDGATPVNRYDFMTVVLHELGHGLGFSGAANVSGGVGSIGLSGFPKVFDRFVVTETDAPILGFVNPSVALGLQLTSGYNPGNPRGPGAYWGGSTGRAANGGLSARLYTPSTWSTGSSYSHLDDDTYPAGSPDSLMTHAIAQAEAIHDPGLVTLGLLGDSGWVSAGGLIKTQNDSTVYWLQNDRRYAVVSPAAISAMEASGVPGWSFSSITTVPVLPGVPAPLFITLDANSNGLLIRQLGTSTVYVVQNGWRRPFLSLEALAWNGVNWLPDVIDVSFTLLTSFTHGVGITVHAIGEGETNPAIRQSFAAAYARLMNAATCGTTSWAGWPGAFATCLALPQSEVIPTVPSAVSGLPGKFQNFGTGTSRRGVLHHSQLGTFGVWGAILDKWQELGTSASALGHPMTDEYQWGALRRSDFEGGYVTWNGTTATVVFNTPVPAPLWKISPPNGATGQLASVTLSWATSSGASSYEFCVDSSPNSTCNTAWISVGSATTALASGLRPGATYHWQVRAVSTAGITEANDGQWWSFSTRPITDLNGDGIGDILLQNQSTSHVAAWLMNGAGQTASFVDVYPADTMGFRVVGRLDLNGDGIGDILLQDPQSTYVGAWLMNASGQAVSFVLVYPANVAGWKVVGTLDLNADGIADILLQDTTTTYVAAWLMDSAGQATSFIPVYFDNVNGWRVVATADLNHDGILDIVLQESTSTSVGGWIMNSSGQPISFVPVHFASTGSWLVAGSEDLNGDGILDILLQDTVSTHVAAWIMNSAGQPISFDLFYPASVGAWQVKGRR